MKIEKVNNQYSVVIRTDKGLIIIWFTDITDRQTEVDPDFGAMNCVFLRDENRKMITVLWDTQAEEFRAAFAKLTEDTDNA